MPVFSLSNKGKIFHREIKLGNAPAYERILVTCPTKAIKEIIHESLHQGIYQLPPSPTRNQLEAQASKTSEFLHKQLPFNMFNSAEEYYHNGEQKQAFDEAYFFRDKNATPHTLAELCDEDMLNCIGQCLAINEVLYSKEWGLYNLFNLHGESGHHILASIQGNYCLRIDPSTGPVRKKKEKVNDIYAFNKSCFFNRYEQSRHIYQKQKK